MVKYPTELALARALSRCTENLKPPAFVPVDDCLSIVRRVLAAAFLPVEAVDGPEEHAVFATCAALLGASVRGLALTGPDLTRIYRLSLKAKHASLDSEEAAFLRSIGVQGVHIFDSGKGA